MSIPGLSGGPPGLSEFDPGQGEDASPVELSVRTHSSGPETEYRFEASFTSPVSIKLLSGSAELFGTELAPQVAYTFAGTKAAIFTWDGAALEVTGSPQSAHGTGDTSMNQAANIHFALEDLRVAAEQRHGQGPRVMVVGPENSGKTSLVKILAGYSLKMGRQPVVVNLDPSQGLLSMPGALTATTMATVVDMEEGWGSSPISGPSAVPVKMPLVFHYGCQKAGGSLGLYEQLTRRLGWAVGTRLDEDRDAGSSGCLIDTPGSLAGDHALIKRVASVFSVDIVLAIGPEALYNDIKAQFPDNVPEEKPVHVLQLDKSSGCVDRTDAYMKQFRQNQIRQYFFGHPGMSLSPFTQFVGFNEITIFRINEDQQPSTTDLISDDSEDDDEDDYEPAPVSTAKLERITPSLMLQNIVLAVTHANPTDNTDNILASSVLWYIYVAEVDESKSRLKIISPISGRLPMKALVFGGWPEGVPDLAA
ncbi:Clp1-domain-containing protein [Microthyrium microscopicum]|uniref:Polynucleotide 5'-hydroxyl-kinase GRC3 n=1 Tax=Microthyrium microscopicum TaxID=703497 RepID=A0A6A6UHM3_9PEZI|nr:Clp1-domain-containing protein [Microthyrium microscopicum]